MRLVSPAFAAALAMAAVIAAVPGGFAAAESQRHRPEGAGSDAWKPLAMELKARMEQDFADLHRTLGAALGDRPDVACGVAGLVGMLGAIQRCYPDEVAWQAAALAAVADIDAFMAGRVTGAASPPPRLADWFDRLSARLAELNAIVPPSLRQENCAKGDVRQFRKTLDRLRPEDFRAEIEQMLAGPPPQRFACF